MCYYISMKNHTYAKTILHLIADMDRGPRARLIEVLTAGDPLSVPTFKDIKAQLLRDYPGGELCEDETGQLIFYLGLEELPDGTVRSFEG